MIPLVNNLFQCAHPPALFKKRTRGCYVLLVFMPFSVQNEKFQVGFQKSLMKASLCCMQVPAKGTRCAELGRDVSLALFSQCLESVWYRYGLVVFWFCTIFSLWTSITAFTSVRCFLWNESGLRFLMLCTDTPQSFRWFNGFCNYIIPQNETPGTTFQVCARLFFFVGAATAPFMLWKLCLR